MRKILFFVLAVSSTVSAQKKAVIVDSTTKEPVPYVNISSEGNIQLSADENGRFTLPVLDDSKTAYFSAVGYADTFLKILEVNDTVFLHQQVIELDAAYIGKRKRANVLVINPIKKAKETFIGFAGGSTGFLMHAVYIPYNANHSAIPYVDKIRFKIRAQDDNIFNLRLLKVNPDGSPGDYLLDENILVSVKEGQKYAVIDMSDKWLQIPKEGMFVVIEHLAILQNRLGEPEGVDKYPAHLFAYGPGFLIGMSDTKGGWSYKNGEWVEHPKTAKGYAKMVVEVTLTD